MKISEIVEVIKLLKDESNEVQAESGEQCEFIGKKVMIRTYSAGVHFGTLVKRKGKEVTLSEAYRVYSWCGACSLSQLAMEGSADRANGSNKISIPVNKIFLTEAIEMIHMTDKAYDNLVLGELWKK